MIEHNQKSFYRDLMLRMLLVNRFEETVKALFHEGLVHGTLHLCVGEEAAVIGSTAALKEQDYILTTHRGHGECIGKGADLKAMMAEILGRRDGTNGGVGGSMHICDISHGIVGSNGIVGAGAPTACGAALSIRLKKEQDRISVSFFGDGAANSGGILESLNLAGVWKLPMIFILLENGYAVSTPVEKAAGDPDLTKRAIPFGLKSFECDGNDVLRVYETVEKARRFVLENQRPCLVVEHTYRISGHSKSDQNRYRSKEELQYWKDHGPIVRFRKELAESGVFTEAELDKLEQEADRQIRDAVDYAKASPYPSAEGIEKKVYAD